VFEIRQEDTILASAPEVIVSTPLSPPVETVIVDDITTFDEQLAAIVRIQ
jgi:hypothetical protein